MNISKTRSVPLDIVRIFAAFWVLGFHWLTCSGCFYGLRTAPNMDWVPTMLYAPFEWGFLGVDIFFILSGSLIARSALNNEWFNFTRQRFLRLFPAYFLIGILSISLYPLATSSPLSVEKIFSLSGLQFWIGGPAIIAAGWTLPIEIAFYLLVTLSLYLYTKKKTFGTKELRDFLNIWLLLYVLSIWLNFEPLQKLVIPSYAPYFILGATLSLIKSKKDFFSNIFTFSISLVLTLKFVIQRVVTLPQLEHKFIMSFLLVVFMSGIIIYSNRPFTGSTESFSRKFITTLSRMTYPIYLIHLEVGLTFVYFYLTMGLPSQYAFLAALLTILAISYGVVQFFEPLFKRVFNKHFHSRD